MSRVVEPVSAVTVYCASSNLIDPGYLDLAEEVGRAIARRGWELVYGGGSVGMMGRCANAALAQRGRVTGVITGWIAALEVAHDSLTELHTVETMHERKLLMTERGDAFLILPGGFGTLDETFEAITWKQLGLHAKPIVLLNHERFFDPLLAYLRHASDARFIRPEHLGLFYLADSLEDAMAELENPTPYEGAGDRWWEQQAGG